MPVRARRSGLIRIERKDLDGIPCFFGEARGPFTATLIFRVGRADETLATGGLTHLVEHLVMPATPPRAFERNARVEAIFAVFWASGRRDAVLRFLSDTAASIAEPPLERLETERGILSAEAASAGGPGPVGAARALAYGAAGHGLIGYDEYGLPWVGEREVKAWIAERLTRGNAALWMTGKPPAQLELALPEGKRRAAPEPVPLADVTFPAQYGDGPDGLAGIAFEGGRTLPLRVGFDVLVDRAWRTLRYERGLAYEVADWYEPLTATTAHATLSVESLERNTEAVADGILELFDALAADGPTEEELTRDLGEARDQLSDAFELPGYLHFCACDELLGARVLSPDDLVRELEKLAPEDVAAAAAAGRHATLLILPSGGRERTGFSTYPMSSRETLAGRTFPLRTLRVTRAARRSRLIVGDEGVSAVGADGVVSTVRFSECAALLRWPDGSRTLVGRDGFRVHVEPDDWSGAKDAVRAIDEHVPVELVAVMEPELTRRIDAVDDVAAEKLKRRWLVSEELERLPGELAADERLLTVAEANRGLRCGLLAVTDRRVLWLYGTDPERTLELDRSEVEHARVKRGFLERKLVLRARDEELTFGDVVPKQRADEIAALLA